MTKIFYESLLQLAIVLPLIFAFLKKYDKDSIKKILAFSLIFLSYEIVLYLPRYYDFLKIIHGNWNWNGKIMGVLFGILCYFLFRNLFRDHDYFTLKQDKTGFKKALIASIIVVIIGMIVGYIYGPAEFDWETLAFQFTLPGIDEEIMYRGILLGLLMSILKGHVKFIGNPALLIISILFGIIHALNLKEDFTIDFDPLYFAKTALAGYVWGWATIKSKSIVLAILSHNLSNFFGTLATMIK